MRFFSLIALVLLSACHSVSSPAARFAAQRQPLDAFIRDRPAAAALLQHHPQLEHWLRHELQQPIGSYRLAWDAAPPPNGSKAEHRKYPEHSFLVIRVSEQLQPADQLTALLYETLNARGRSRFQQLEEQAASERISRDAFVDGLLATEHAALVRVKELLPQLMPLDPTEQASLKLYPAFLKAPASFTGFEAWRRRHAGSYDVRAIYGRLYDDIRANAKTRNG